MVRDNSENVSSELNRTRHEVDVINMMIQQLNDNFTLLRAQVRRHSFSTGVSTTRPTACRLQWNYTMSNVCACASLKVQSVKHADLGCMLAGSKRLRGDKLPCNGFLSIWKSSSVCVHVIIGGYIITVSVCLSDCQTVRFH